MTLRRLMIVMLLAFLIGFMGRLFMPAVVTPAVLPTLAPTLSPALTATSQTLPYSDEEIRVLNASLWNIVDLGVNTAQTLVTASRRNNPACRYSINGIRLLEVFTVLSCS